MYPIPITNSLSINPGTSIARVFVYGRVSTGDQMKNKNIANGQDITGDSASVTEQPRICKEYINNFKGFCPKCRKSISLIYEDEMFDGGLSGTNDDREGVDKIMELARNGEINLVLAAENDRIGRNQYETQGIRNELIKLGVQVCCVNQPKPIYCPNCYNPFEDDTGVIMDMVSDVKSHLDLARIMRNYKVGMANRVKKGLPSGALAYGLDKVRDEIANGFRSQEYRFDKEKVKVVKRIVREYMDLGLGMWKISQRLNIEGIPSSGGKKWGRSAIKCILNNPTYAGYTRYQRSVVASRKGQKIRIMQPKEMWTLEKAVWYKDRLWDFSYYDQIRKTIERKYSLGGRASGSGGLLIGLLKCGYCGYSMFQENTKKIRDNGNLYVWKGYNCGTYAHRGSCIHNGKAQKKIDDIVIKEVLKLADNDKVRETYLERIKKNQMQLSKESLVDKVEALRNLNTRLSRASDAYLSHDFDLKQYSEIKREVMPRISELESEIDRLRNSLSSNQDRVFPDIKRIVEKIRESYEKGDVKMIQQLLRKIIRRIDFKREPFNIKITFLESRNCEWTSE
jgi:DNA invertase Pin-like site-specific DNA recombinase